MKRFAAVAICLGLAFMVLPLAAGAITDKKSGTEYPNEVIVGAGDESATLVATGVGMRQKSIVVKKFDIYTIVSYAHDQAKFEGDLGEAIIMLNAPKRLQLDLRRGFSRDKLINAFVNGIKANYDDLTTLEADIATFSAYFTRDAQEDDKIIFHFCPAVGLTTELNGEEMGTIENVEFAQALWSVWFGKKPANGGLKKALLAEIDS